jgi:hypothetical protein
MKLSALVLLLFLLGSGFADAKAKKVDDYHWTGVERVIAIGDLHGDYDRYIEVMQSAGLIDGSGNWSGGDTHFVQTGDITDRGPDSRKIIDHLVKLAKQARKKGGYVHMLIGNHETMNVIGDLRYVHKGEFEAFTTRNSSRLQATQWDRQVRWMRTNVPEFDQVDLKAYRLEWEQKVPLGWVEHRMAWSLDGKYGQWVKNNQVAVMVNDSIFLHGGISAKYCKFSLETLTEQVMDAMKDFSPGTDSVLNDPLGPIWYRGLAEAKEADIYSRTLDNILERYGAKRIVVGHSPTGGVVWPRFDQRVIVNDTGIATHYGAHKGVLEITADGLTAIYGDQRILIPADNGGREDYLRAVIQADSNNSQLKNRLARMLAPPVERTGDDAQAENEDSSAAAPISSPGNCR